MLDAAIEKSGWTPYPGFPEKADLARCVLLLDLAEWLQLFGLGNATDAVLALHAAAEKRVERIAKRTGELQDAITPHEYRQRRLALDAASKLREGDLVEAHWRANQVAAVSPDWAVSWLTVSFFGAEIFRAPGPNFRRRDSRRRRGYAERRGLGGPARPAHIKQNSPPRLTEPKPNPSQANTMV